MWAAGLVSLGAPTAAQIAFMTTRYPSGADVFGFPGDFISAGHTIDPSDALIQSADDDLYITFGPLQFDPDDSNQEVVADDVSEIDISGATGSFTLDGGTGHTDGRLAFRIGAVSYGAIGDPSTPPPDTTLALAGHAPSIYGTQVADVLIGTAADEFIEGFSGADILKGGGGNDDLAGGTGDDVLAGGTGTNTLDGGDGIDVADYSDFTTPVNVNLGLGAGRSVDTSDTLVSIESVRGGAGADRLIAGARTGLDVVEKPYGTDNSSPGLAIDLDGQFTLIRDTSISNSTRTPHVSIDATASGSLSEEAIDYYSFTVATAGAGGIVRLSAATTGQTLQTSVTDIASGAVLSGTVRPDGSVAYTFTAAGRYLLNVSGTSDPLPPGAGYSLTLSIPGAVIPDAIDYWLDGGAGPDTLIGLATNAFLNGGTGIDNAIFTGLYRDFTTDLYAGDGIVKGGISQVTDRLSSIEYATFDDGFLTFDPDSNAAKVMRLYETVLARAPDPAGLDLWLDTLDAGASFTIVAQGFLGSPEFQAATGSLSNADYVEYLYVHALGRASDAAGKAGWVAALDGGAGRADILVGFSESAEDRGRTADTLGQGLFVTDNVYQEVAALYDTFANRRPDQAGLDSWVGALKSGEKTLAQVAEGFAGSQEFRSRTDGLSNPDLVEFMYRNTLDRGSDPSGRASWVAALDGGLSRGGLILAFAESSEHLSLISADINGGIALG